MSKDDDLFAYTTAPDEIWRDRESGMDMGSIDFNRPISSAEINALKERYAFLQMVNSDPHWPDAITPMFRRVIASGWIIHDYDQAMSASPGIYLFGLEIPRKNTLVDAGTDEAGGSDLTLLGKGTYIKQTVDTAIAMVAYAIEKGWPGLEIIDGTQLMKWAAWFAAEQHNYPLLGFEPTEYEKQKSARIRAWTHKHAVSHATPAPGIQQDD